MMCINTPLSALTPNTFSYNLYSFIENERNSTHDTDSRWL
ncbi:hypothetical protein FHS57_005202 [Runella defluvii]|uniref:Uncharacterized protein n=1 Tax=Runella defluvii TaxID=370973 RepID=A0A7W5ZS94_9BACT|nr:hypothetical protein [Runella defluvii]